MCLLNTHYPLSDYFQQYNLKFLSNVADVIYDMTDSPLFYSRCNYFWMHYCAPPPIKGGFVVACNVT